MEKPEKLYTNIKQEIGKLKLESAESTREELNTLKNDIKSKIAKENYRTIIGIWNGNVEKFKYILGNNNISIPKNIDDSIIFIKKILNKSGFNKTDILENNEISTEYLSSIIGIQKTNSLKIDGIFGNQMVKHIYENIKKREVTSVNLSNLSESNPKVSVSQSEVVSANSVIKLNGGVDNLSEASMQLQIKQEYENLKKTLPEKLVLRDGVSIDIVYMINKAKEYISKSNSSGFEEYKNKLKGLNNPKIDDMINMIDKNFNFSKKFFDLFPDDLQNDKVAKNIPIINNQNINDPKTQLAFGKGIIYILTKKKGADKDIIARNNFMSSDDEMLITFTKAVLNEESNRYKNNSQNNDIKVANSNSWVDKSQNK